MSERQGEVLAPRASAPPCDVRLRDLDRPLRLLRPDYRAGNGRDRDRYAPGFGGVEPVGGWESDSGRHAAAALRNLGPLSIKSFSTGKGEVWYETPVRLRNQW